MFYSFSCSMTISDYRLSLELSLDKIVNEDTGDLSLSKEEAHDIAFGYSDEAIADIMRHSTPEEYAEMYLM